MRVSKVWVSEKVFDQTAVREIIVDFDNDFHIAINFGSVRNNSPAPAEEFISELLNAVSNIAQKLKDGES